MKNGILLNQCDPKLRHLFMTVEQYIPVEILPSTIRTLEEQKDFFKRGVTKTMNSKHLITDEHPFSRAVDAGPYPHRWPKELSKDYWKDWSRLYYFAGRVIEIGRSMDIIIRYGGDWNGNGELKDENFFDGVHFELVE